MIFNPDEFNTFLTGIGQQVQWRRAFACPCVNPNTGQAKINCPVCKGKAKVWQDPVDTVVGVVSGNVVNKWQQFGLADPGDVILSIPSSSPAYEIGPYDRVKFMNRTEPFSHNIVKGVNEKIRFSVVAIDKVFILTDNGATLTEVAPPAINPDGSLNWAGVPIPDGATFSIAGRRHTEYFCFPDSFFGRPHHAGAALPRKVVLRRFDLYGSQ